MFKVIQHAALPLPSHFFDREDLWLILNEWHILAGLVLHGCVPEDSVLKCYVGVWKHKSNTKPVVCQVIGIGRAPAVCLTIALTTLVLVHT